MEFHLLISNHRHVFRTIIDPLQCDAEYPIDRKILSAMGIRTRVSRVRGRYSTITLRIHPVDKLEISMKTYRHTYIQKDSFYNIEETAAKYKLRTRM